jgi:7,8-dihydro-6-hydroxymethylpterin-pyrophosphokinase
VAAPRTGYLGLGSNVGDAAGHLRAAVELLEAEGIAVEVTQERGAEEDPDPDG